MSTGILVIPCYNEARRLDVAQFREFARADARWQLLMVNDGSTDETMAVLTMLADENPGRIHVCDLVRNSGKAEAVRRGILAAIERGPNYVGFLDADLATPFSEVGRLLDVLERRPDIEIVVGTRMPLLGRNIARRRARSLLGRLFGLTASRMIGLPLYDTQCGAKVFRVSERIAELFADRFHSRWIFDVELFARLVVQCRSDDVNAAANVVYELPLDEWRDVAGSKLRAKDFLRAVFELLSIFDRYFIRNASSTRGDTRWATPAMRLLTGTTTAPPISSKAGKSPANQHRRAA